MTQTMIRITVAALLLSVAALAHADTIEFLSGAQSEGTVLDRTDTTVKFETKIGGMGITRDYELSTIHAITVDGKREVINKKGDPKPKPVRPAQDPYPPQDQPADEPADDEPTQATDDGRPKRTAAEVRALIQKVGPTPPDWFDSTPLNYPKTLDLSWPKPTGAWNTRKHIAHYMWSIIDENPSKWREGTKFMHHVLSTNKGNREAQKQAMVSLGHCYHDLLGDWVRGAFWLENAQKAGAKFPETALANCYWQLGSQQLAEQVLNGVRVDVTRYGSAIKLWSDMGRLDNAKALASASSRRNPVGAFMGLADAMRHHGRYKEALTYYQKMLDLPDNATRKDVLTRNKGRARAGINAIKAEELLDITKVPDGKYRGSSFAYNGDLEVEVEMKSGKIVNIKITKIKDKQFYSSLTDTPAKIIEKQSVKGIDTTAEATVTSQAIVNATAAALVDQMK